MQWTGTNPAGIAAFPVVSSSGESEPGTSVPTPGTAALLA